MIPLLLRRLLLTLPMVFVALTLTLVMVRMAPRSPFDRANATIACIDMQWRPS
jgi:ABC-type microcin C transport system permease subunit YejB